VKFTFPTPKSTDITLQWKDKTHFTEVLIPTTIPHLFCDEPSNRLILGDNKKGLASLLPQFHDKVQLIYLDPPFASDATYSASLMIGKKRIKFPQYKDHWERHEYLQFLYERLVLLHALLHTKGLLILHLDENIVHEAKLILDEIFGVSNFRSEIIWELGTGAKSRKIYSIQHNTLLIYSKSDSWYFNAHTSENRIPFSETSIKTHFKNIDENGRKYRRRHVNGKDYIYYADEGKMVGSVWTDISSMLGTSPIMKESTGYPTQKPQKLLQRLITSCSKEGDIVLDPFMGSGSTLRTAYNSNRRYIGLDKNTGSFQTVVENFLKKSDINININININIQSHLIEPLTSTIQAKYTIKDQTISITIIHSPLQELLDVTSPVSVQEWLSFVIVHYRNQHGKLEQKVDSSCTLQYQIDSSWSDISVEIWDKMGNYGKLNISTS
jgi:DNA modification methylase